MSRNFNVREYGRFAGGQDGFRVKLLLEVKNVGVSESQVPLEGGSPEFHDNIFGVYRAGPLCMRMEWECLKKGGPERP